jgi:MoaA/NifB/PqqE/SkfB family radical SAM enzyme
MCHIWQKSKADNFNVDLLSRLPRNLKNITLSGGEPFLRRDLPLFIGKLRSICPYARIVITSNGILTDLIIQNVRDILKIEPDIVIRVSLDGIGETHDKVRGYSGAYNCVINTLIGLKAIGVRDLGILFLAMNANIDQAYPVYELSNKMGLEFNLQVAHSSDFYFRKQNEEIIDKEIFSKQLNAIIRSELKTFNPYKLLKAYYYKGLGDYVNRFARPYKCYAGSLFGYIDSRGDVYPCIVSAKKMGSLKEHGLKEIWRSQQAENVRASLIGCSNNCWMICVASPAIKNRPHKALAWVLINKIKAHANLGVV